MWTTRCCLPARASGSPRHPYVSDLRATPTLTKRGRVTGDASHRQARGGAFIEADDGSGNLPEYADISLISETKAAISIPFEWPLCIDPTHIITSDGSQVISPYAVDDVTRDTRLWSIRAAKGHLRLRISASPPPGLLCRALRRVRPVRPRTCRDAVVRPERDCQRGRSLQRRGGGPAACLHRSRFTRRRP